MVSSMFLITNSNENICLWTGTLYIQKEESDYFIETYQIGDQNYIIFFLFEKFYPLCFD